MPLLSKTLRSVAYQAGTTTLEVERADGSVYRYFGVPECRFRGLLAAAPPDDYLERHITKVFRTVKVPQSMTRHR